MKVLVATAETQGARDDDFCWTVDGELVYVPFATCPKPTCGCDRAFAGLASSKATTTAMVVEREAIDTAAYATALSDGLTRQGWLHADTPQNQRWLVDFIHRHRELGEAFPEGAVVEVSDGHVRTRVTERW